ncbi:MAG: Xaa-Pro peptidase family protein [Methanomassiliicoccales archaeon]|nr:Xaa-Pro peptidase family protein [Methanomassiliicoccales archaeon]
MKSRNARLFEFIGDRTDAVVIVNGHDTHVDQNFRYFVQADSGVFEGSALIIEKKKLSVITSPLEASALSGTDASVTVAKGADEFDSSLRRKLSGFGSIGMNFPALTHDGYRRVRKNFRGKIVDCSKAISQCRAVKDEHELRRLSVSCRIASKVAASIPEMLKDGMTERELSSSISVALYEEGSESPSFPPIVSFGRTSAIPHYSPGGVRLKKGSFVLADFGGTYQRYCSDITRTFVYGKANSRQRELYNTVLEAQKSALSVMKAGVTGKQADAAARKVIDDSRFKGTFIHSLGHGLGMQVHDGQPVLWPRGKEKLEEGMVVTVEPGAYIQGFGGVRIEDDVVITPNGVKILTDAPREFIEC